MSRKQVVREDAPLNVQLVEILKAHNKPLTVNDLAAIIPFSRFTIYDWVKQNKIPHMRIVGKVLFDPAKTAEWLAERCA